MIRAVIFDFDGVILESAVIKTEAFGEVVKDYPKKEAEEFVAYHMTHMGISRHVKFKYFIEEILKEQYTDEKEKKLADDFERIVFDRVMTCSFVPGAKEFLEKYYDRYDFFIASGTPDEEMNRIVDGRGLRKYFKGVYGTPAKKPEIIDKILQDYGYDRSEAVFVGDAGTDLKAAAATGLEFIGRNTEENSEVFSEVKYRIDDLMQIESIVGEIEKT
ncbi:MAG: HAD hydrolase-like protein [Lachnospiraceae bacterium]|nr:HAD hydrolase-like protein [Lachnospiraceae bacterium]